MSTTDLRRACELLADAFETQAITDEYLLAQIACFLNDHADIAPGGLWRAEIAAMGNDYT